MYIEYIFFPLGIEELSPSLRSNASMNYTTLVVQWSML